MKHLQRLILMLALCGLVGLGATTAHAQQVGHDPDPDPATAAEHGGSKSAAEHAASPFTPHAGTWLNGIVRMFTGESKPILEKADDGGQHVENADSVKYDVYFITALVLGGIGVLGVLAGKQARLRPDGKPHSLANLVEAAFEGYYDYLVGIMGRELATKYTPLIGTFFFTILICNWLGLIPGLAAPTANANVPISLAIIAFFATHIIAIKEVGVKSWFMHFVGEPKWLAFLNFPLHIIGELIKPLSLAIRLLCNVFGEEMVIVKLTTMAAVLLPIFLPIPFQFPIMCLGVFFGALQALVFSTLLAIYISILSTHSDDHGGHGHVEHVVIEGHPQTIAHGTQTSVA